MHMTPAAHPYTNNRNGTKSLTRQSATPLALHAPPHVVGIDDKSLRTGISN